jgi:hypothetical protein
MAKSIKLSKILEAMDAQGQDGSAYFDTTTGEVITVSEEEMRMAEDADDEDLDDSPEWERELIEKNQQILEDETGRFLQLPDKFEIHEYQIMERFCSTIEDIKISTSLYNNLKGSEAFRRFKNGIHIHGVENDWYKYREEAFKEIAIEWCQMNELEYVDDVKQK